MEENPRPKKKPPSGAQNRKRRLERGGPKRTDKEKAQAAAYAKKQVRKYKPSPSSKLYAPAKRKWLSDLKLSYGCTDCGYNAHPAALHFDHLPGVEKLGNITYLVSRVSRAALLEEIAKCEVVCANCHAIRTANRRVKPED